MSKSADETGDRPSMDLDHTIKCSMGHLEYSPATWSHKDMTRAEMLRFTGAAEGCKETTQRCLDIVAAIRAIADEEAAKSPLDPLTSYAAKLKFWIEGKDERIRAAVEAWIEEDKKRLGATIQAAVKAVREAALCEFATPTACPCNEPLHDHHDGCPSCYTVSA